MEFEFRKLNKITENRKNQCDLIRTQFPDKIPVICERDPKSNLPDLDKHKYLVPQDFTFSQFIDMIRRRLELQIDVITYFLVNGKDLILGDKLFSEIYNKYKNYQDDLLYIAYTDSDKWL